MSRQRDGCLDIPEPQVASGRSLPKIRKPHRDSSRGLFRRVADAQPGPEIEQSAPASLLVPDRLQSCRLPYNFDNSPASHVALDLPPGNSLLLSTKGCNPAQPEHACSEMRLRGCMIEENSGLAAQLSHVESILHQQENIYVGRFSLRGHERSEHDESRQLPCADRQTINSFEPLRHNNRCRVRFPNRRSVSCRVTR